MTDAISGMMYGFSVLIWLIIRLMVNQHNGVTPTYKLANIRGLTPILCPMWIINSEI